MLGLAVGVVGAVVVMPALAASGHVLEAIGVAVIYFIVRALFGQDDADEYLEKQHERKQKKRKEWYE